MVHNRAGSLAVLLGLTAASAFAGRFDPSAQPCVGGTLQSYINLGNTGCTVGDLTFFKFGFLSDANLPWPFGFLNVVPKNPDTKIANASNINVSPANEGGDVGVGFSSDYFKVGDGDKLRYLFTYTIDPPPDILPGFDLGMDAFSPVFPGSAKIDALVCAGGKLGVASLFNLPDACLPVQGATNYEDTPYKLKIEHLGVPGQIYDLDKGVVFEKPTNYMQVWMLVTLDGGPKNGGGSSQISGMTTSVNVPEASSLAHLGFDFSVLGLALLLFRRA